MYWALCLSSSLFSSLRSSKFIRRTYIPQDTALLYKKRRQLQRIRPDGNYRRWSRHHLQRKPGLGSATRTERNSKRQERNRHMG